MFQKASAIRVVEIHFINSSLVVKNLVAAAKPFMNKQVSEMVRSQQIIIIDNFKNRVHSNFEKHSSFLINKKTIQIQPGCTVVVLVPWGRQFESKKRQKY